VDNDDGSAYYETYSNFLVYSGNGMKNDFGGETQLYLLIKPSCNRNKWRLAQLVAIPVPEWRLLKCYKCRA
jgi:hypothetical protein